MYIAHYSNIHVLSVGHISRPYLHTTYVYSDVPLLHSFNKVKQ